MTRKLEKYDNTRLEDILSKQRKDNNIFGLGFEVGQSYKASNNKKLYDIFRSEFQDAKVVEIENNKECSSKSDLTSSHKNIASDLQSKDKNFTSGSSSLIKPRYPWRSKSYLFGFFFCNSRFGHKAFSCQFTQRRKSYFDYHSMRCINCHRFGYTNKFCKFALYDWKMQIGVEFSKRGCSKFVLEVKDNNKNIWRPKEITTIENSMIVQVS